MQTQPLNIPKHIAIIMDGNGRWAQDKNLSRSIGHEEGGKRVDDVVTYSREINLQYLTLYAFSSENWNRPDTEINSLLKILLDFSINKKQKLLDNDVKVNLIGDINRFPKEIFHSILELEEVTKKCKSMVLTLALSYSARDELVRGVKNLLQQSHLIDIDKLDYNLIQSYLDTKTLPDPDLIIRTSGEQRLSNFLSLQGAYSELYFVEKYWPDFYGQDLKEAILEFNHRERRFGNLKYGIRKVFKTLNIESVRFPKP